MCCISRSHRFNFGIRFMLWLVFYFEQGTLSLSDETSAQDHGWKIENNEGSFKYSHHPQLKSSNMWHMKFESCCNILSCLPCKFVKEISFSRDTGRKFSDNGGQHRQHLFLLPKVSKHLTLHPNMFINNNFPVKILVELSPKSSTYFFRVFITA